MSLKEQMFADLKDAMRAKEAAKVATLRLLQAAIKNKEIEVRPNELTDKDVIAVLKKAAKQRKDSIEQYTKAGRQDLADQETAELAVVDSYLPEQMSEEKVTAIVNEAIAEVGASTMKEMGAVMKVVQEKTKGSADNKLVSQIIKSQLQ